MLLKSWQYTRGSGWFDLQNGCFARALWFATWFFRMPRSDENDCKMVSYSNPILYFFYKINCMMQHSMRWSSSCGRDQWSSSPQSIDVWWQSVPSNLAPEDPACGLLLKACSGCSTPRWELGLRFGNPTMSSSPWQYEECPPIAFFLEQPLWSDSAAGESVDVCFPEPRIGVFASAIVRGLDDNGPPEERFEWGGGLLLLSAKGTIVCPAAAASRQSLVGPISDDILCWAIAQLWHYIPKMATLFVQSLQ